MPQCTQDLGSCEKLVLSVNPQRLEFKSQLAIPFLTLEVKSTWFQGVERNNADNSLLKISSKKLSHA